MSRVHALVTALVLGSTVAASADEAFTVRQSESRIKMKAVLSSGKAVTLVSFDGELASVRVGTEKIGISARLSDATRTDSGIEVRLWRLAPGRNDSETITILERFEPTTPGHTLLPTHGSAKAVLRSLEILGVTPADRATRDEPAAAGSSPGI